MLNRKIKPNPNGKIDFLLPEIHSFHLDNSLKVYFVQKKTLPIIQTNIYLPSGSINDPVEKNGLSLLTSMLIDENAGALNGFQISDIIESLGSILQINSNKEFTNISLLSLTENYEKSLEIVSTIILQPNFKIDDFNREIVRLKTQILQLNDDPDFIASSNFNKTIYENTSYANPPQGYENTLNKITNNEVINFHSQKYFSKETFLVVVGNLEIENTRNLLNKYFSDWRINNSINVSNSKPKETENQILFFHKEDAAQSEIRIGHISKGRNTNDFYSRSILNSILGGQFSSRINLNLREDKGYTYGAHSGYSYNKLGSIFNISTSVKSENTTDAINEILYELNQIKETITLEEVEFAKSYLVRRYPSLFETYSQIANNVALIPIFDLQENYFNYYTDFMNNVNLGDVNKAAIEEIKLDKLIIVVVGNKKIIGDQIKLLAEKINYKFVQVN